MSVILSWQGNDKIQVIKKAQNFGRSLCVTGLQIYGGPGSLSLDFKI